MSWQGDQLPPPANNMNYNEPFPEGFASSYSYRDRPRFREPDFGGRSDDRQPVQDSGSPSAYNNGDASASTLPHHNFDILAWHGPYQACQKYFLDHGQHEEAAKILMAFINIKLPHQFTTNTAHSSHDITTSTNPSSPSSQTSARPPLAPTYPSQPYSQPPPTHHPPPVPSIPLHPYIRRLLVTNFLTPSILLPLFGPTYPAGLGSIIEVERRNYLFTAKSVPWAEVKKCYDMDEGQICPFLMPLDDCLEEELGGAERAWGRWLGMQDWMVGARRPRSRGDGDERHGRREEGELRNGRGGRGNGVGSARGGLGVYYS